LKIVDIHIYGYGQLENVTFSDLENFQVFFGENEAGKSTIMAFIHGILFGFPTKQQSSELRYEPKNGAKYGGKIRIFHKEHGFAVIERVKGKAAGDVKVALDNGTVGGEELLKDLLSNFDKSLFQAIFSFNLHGLQNIHQMKGEDIGKFLFSAGTLGTERLARTEASLQKELDSRFKPGGKKPILNEKFHEIHDLHKELKKAAAKNQEYEQLVEKKLTLQQEMEEITISLQELKEEADKLSEWKKIRSLVQEEKQISKERKEMGDFQFPVRGIERLEQLNQSIRPLKGQMISVQERIDQLKQEILSSQPDLSFLENESVLMSTLDQIPLVEQMMLEKQKCETRLTEMDEKLVLLKEKLHLSINDEEILAINTNIFMKNEVESIAKKGQKLIELQQDLEKRFQEEKDSLENIEKDVQFAESQILSEKERAILEEQINEGSDKKGLEIEWTTVKDKMKFYQDETKRERSLQQQRWIQFMIFELILLGFTFYSLKSSQWILFSLGLIGCIMMLIFMTNNFRDSKQKDIRKTLDRLKEKEKKLQEKLQSAEFRDLSFLIEQIKLDDHRRDNLQILNIKLEGQQNQYERVIAKFEDWEKEAREHKKKLVALSSNLRIPEYMAQSHLDEAFELIEQFKVVGREKQHLLERMKQISLEQARIAEEVNFFTNRYLSETNKDLHKIAYLLRNKLKEEHEKYVKCTEKQRKLEDFAADIQQLNREHQQLQFEKEQLFNEAGVEDEQFYYEIGNKAEKKRKLLERLFILQEQLQYSLLNEAERESFLQIHHAEELIAEYNNKALTLKSRLTELQEEQASIKFEIQVLEEGGVYSELLHQFRQKKFELEKEAKTWAVYHVAQDLLANTIEKYKNIHLPKMLAKAEEYLSFLTSGNYQKIHLQRSGTGFLIERKDHTLFEANELSQATTEQVYVSIRFALATTLYENFHFPIMVDDSFVNFDARRTQKVLQLLKKLKKNQIFFFTCHEHLLNSFSKESILQLTKNTIEIHS
jgi:uncharacterized protein YhaN